MAGTTTLTDRTNSYLDLFTTHRFKADELKAAIPLTKSSYGGIGGGLTENFTNATSVSGRYSVEGTGEETGVQLTGLVMDLEDRDKAERDLKAFKDQVSTLKFAYLESDIKLQFVLHIIEKMDGNDPQLVTMEENAELEKERFRTKAELRERKVRAKELEELIREEATVLEHRLQQRTTEADAASKLLKECEAMETELILLKTKRNPTERITIEEAQQMCEQQEMKLASIGPDIAACELKMRETKSMIRAHKIALDKLGGVKRDMTREQEEREAVGMRDERAEKECAWITNASALFSTLLGIRSASAVGSPPHKLVIVYESMKKNEEDLRTLCIRLGPEGNMVGAELEASLTDIQDIVAAYLPSQDMQALVAEVRARMAE